MTDVTPAVEISHLVKDFKTSFAKKLLRAVDDVSLRIMPGEVYGLIGPQTTEDTRNRIRSGPTA